MSARFVVVTVRNVVIIRIMDLFRRVVGMLAVWGVQFADMIRFSVCRMVVIVMFAVGQVRLVRRFLLSIHQVAANLA